MSTYEFNIEKSENLLRVTKNWLDNSPPSFAINLIIRTGRDRELVIQLLEDLLDKAKKFPILCEFCKQDIHSLDEDGIRTNCSYCGNKKHTIWYGCGHCLNRGKTPLAYSYCCHCGEKYTFPIVKRG